MSFEQLMHLVRLGGVTMAVILVASVVSLGVAFERLIALWGGDRSALVSRHGYRVQATSVASVLGWMSASLRKSPRQRWMPICAPGVIFFRRSWTGRSARRRSGPGSSPAA